MFVHSPTFFFFFFLVILGPQPVIDAGSGRCFWRASTHPDQEIMSGKRQREVAGGGSRKKGETPGQQADGGGAGAGLELPGACVSLRSAPYMRDVDCPMGGEIERGGECWVLYCAAWQMLTMH